MQGDSSVKVLRGSLWSWNKMGREGIMRILVGSEHVEKGKVRWCLVERGKGSSNGSSMASPSTRSRRRYLALRSFYINCSRSELKSSQSSDLTSRYTQEYLSVFPLGNHLNDNFGRTYLNFKLPTSRSVQLHLADRSPLPSVQRPLHPQVLSPSQPLHSDPHCPQAARGRRVRPPC
jgi:hypothetical protein